MIRYRRLLSPTKACDKSKCTCCNGGCCRCSKLVGWLLGLLRRQYWCLSYSAARSSAADVVWRKHEHPDLYSSRISRHQFSHSSARLYADGSSSYSSWRRTRVCRTRCTSLGACAYAMHLPLRPAHGLRTVGFLSARRIGLLRSACIGALMLKNNRLSWPEWQCHTSEPAYIQGACVNVQSKPARPTSVDIYFIQHSLWHIDDYLTSPYRV